MRKPGALLERCLGIDERSVPLFVDAVPSLHGECGLRPLVVPLRTGRRRSCCGAPPRRTRDADRLGHPFSRAYGRVMQAIPLMLSGANDEASRSVREGLALGASEDMPAVLAIGRLFEALIESELGRASAEGGVERAVAAWEATGQRQFLGIARLFLADALEREGEEARALTLLEEECRRSAKQVTLALYRARAPPSPWRVACPSRPLWSKPNPPCATRSDWRARTALTLRRCGPPRAWLACSPRETPSAQRPSSRAVAGGARRRRRCHRARRRRSAACRAAPRRRASYLDGHSEIE